MKVLNIRIELENEAFQEDEVEEIGIILRELAAYYKTYGLEERRTLRDANGNTCGVAEVENK